MIWNTFLAMNILAFVLLALGLICKVNSGKAIFFALSMVLFSFLSGNAFNVSTPYQDLNGNLAYAFSFSDWEMQEISWTETIFFIISLILFLVAIIESFGDYKLKKNGGRSNERYSG